MSKFLIVIFFFTTLSYSNSNSDLDSTKSKYTPYGIHLIGWNTPLGLGFSFSNKLWRNSFIESGIGFGIWGAKVSSGVKVYLSQENNQYGRLSSTYNTGLPWYSSYVEVNEFDEPTKRENVRIKFDHGISMTLMYGYNLKKKSNPLFVEFGYSQKVWGYNYRFRDLNSKLPNNTKGGFEMLKHNGVALGFNYYFGSK
jgi:hypothetical protein